MKSFSFNAVGWLMLFFSINKKIGYKIPQYKNEPGKPYRLDEKQVGSVLFFAVLFFKIVMDEYVSVFVLHISFFCFYV